MREGWVYKKLGEVANIKSGYTPSSSDLSDSGVIPYFKVGDMNNVGNEKYLHYTSSFVNETFKSFPKNSIVFPKNGAAIATNKKRILKQSSVVDLNTAVLIPTQTENIEFLFYWISNIDFRDITRRGTIPTLDTKTLMLLEIPVPPLSEQQRIVSELDLLSSIIEKKKAQLKEYDQLAQSIFYDMFGDPVTNEKGWEVKKLGEVCSLKAGKAIKSSELKEKADNLYPCYGGNGIRGFIERLSHKDDLPIIGRQGALCGNVNFAKAPFYATEHAVVVSPLIEMNKFWLYHQLRFLHLEQYAHGVAQPGIAVNDLIPISIPLPPLPLQQSFASKIEAIERQKSLIQQSITEAETLFNSRMDYWFS